MDTIISLFCPCFKTGSNSNRNGGLSETELTSSLGKGSAYGEDSSLSSLYYISRKMSAPTIEIQGLTVKGHGLALVDVSIDQDCAYWEWHVNTSTKNGDATTNVSSFDDNEGEIEQEDDFFQQGLTMKFGVATRKDRAFYRALDSNEDDGVPMEDGTALMKPIQNIQNGDTIGIAIQQDDLPMVQFLLNGEPLHEIAINRFRGTVYPSVFIEGDGDSDHDNLSVDFVWKEDNFKEMSPSVRFKPLMAAIGII